MTLFVHCIIPLHCQCQCKLILIISFISTWHENNTSFLNLLSKEGRWELLRNCHRGFGCSVGSNPGPLEVCSQKCGLGLWKKPTNLVYLPLCLSVSAPLSVVCLSFSLSLSFFYSFFYLSVSPSIHPSFHVFFSFFLFLVSNFPFKWKVHHFSLSQNARRERELFLVPESRWREVSGNCFHEKFVNCRDMTEKLQC